jgi:16S rRNA (guanine966-N2)-methyltransferase
MDKVRAAIFSSLAELVPGARVLDLFAGSGALGIEALSRGAASAIFVDADPRSVTVIRQNLLKTRLAAGQAICADAYRFLAGNTAPFDLIFADPPYGRGAASGDHALRLVGAPALRAALAPDGLWVLEAGAGSLPDELPGWTITRRRRYGAAEVLFAAAA